MKISNEWENNDPLAQCKGETKKANDALRDYALLGPGRSLGKLAKKHQHNTGTTPIYRERTLKAWSTDNDWQARAAAFDQLEFDARLERRQARIEQLEDEDWQTGQKLRKLGTEILEQMPKFTRTSEGYTTDPNGERVKVITISLNFTLAQVTQALITSSKLQRLSTDEPTDNISLSGAALDAAIEHEFARLLNAGQEGDSGRTDEENAGSGSATETV